MSASHAVAQVAFLTNLQRLLEEGNFVATYKFALLLSLADLAVEKGDDSDRPLRLSTEEIAEKFITYYWRQVAPFPAVATSPAVLAQNTGKQASIVNAIEQARSVFGDSLPQAQRRGAGWLREVRRVARTIEQMPLWKLQTVATGPHEFLYRNQPGAKEIELLPGVSQHLRTFHSLVRNLVQGAWVRFVRQLPTNQSLLGGAVGLDEFLFGSERTPLSAAQPLLREVQENRCLYCQKRMKGTAEVDHFVPWVRYPVDLGHNLVLAHPQCNREKRDYLAAAPHLQALQERNRAHEDQLRLGFDAAGILHDAVATSRVAEWAYGTAERSRSLVWLSDSGLVSLDPTWRTYLLWSAPTFAAAPSGRKPE